MAITGETTPEEYARKKLLKAVEDIADAIVNNKGNPQPAPVVNVAAPSAPVLPPAPAPVVKVSVPEHKPVSFSIEVIERDENGDIKKAIMRPIK